MLGKTRLALFVAQNGFALTPRDNELACRYVLLETGMRAVLKSDLDLSPAADLVEELDLEHRLIATAFFAEGVEASDLEQVPFHHAGRYDCGARRA